MECKEYVNGIRPRANLHHTNTENPVWWMVDLRGTYVIEQIVLTNRPDSFSIRLKDFQIEVFETDPRDSPAFPNVTGKVCLTKNTAVSNGTYTWNCTTPLVGRRHLQCLHAVEYEIMVSEVLRRVFSAYKKKELDNRLSTRPL
ncbi:hypothetical protein Btru_062145 [Bulinus truncatus]|nr:hypothetical protein Btru_062145 [Bulinus truncatus]